MSPGSMTPAEHERALENGGRPPPTYAVVRVQRGEPLEIVAHSARRLAPASQPEAGELWIAHPAKTLRERTP